MLKRHENFLSNYYKKFLMVTFNFCAYLKVERG